jgi:hypothetical protein
MCSLLVKQKLGLQREVQELGSTRGVLMAEKHLEDE